MNPVEKLLEEVQDTPDVLSLRTVLESTLGGKNIRLGDLRKYMDHLKTTPAFPTPNLPGAIPRAVSAVGHACLSLDEEEATALRRDVFGCLQAVADAVGRLDSVHRLYLDWALSTFPQATPESCAAHLLREAEEFVEDGGRDPGEAADILFLAFHACHLAGIDPAQAMREKLRENVKRRWNAPDEEGVQEHVRRDHTDPDFWEGGPLEVGDPEAAHVQEVLLDGEAVENVVAVHEGEGWVLRYVIPDPGEEHDLLPHRAKTERLEGEVKVVWKGDA